MKTLNPAEVPAVGFSIDCKLNDRRAMVIQTHLPSDAMPAAMYVLLNGLCKVADTLDTRYRLIDMKLILQKSLDELPVLERRLETYENDVVGKHSTSGRRKDFEWKGQDKTNRDNLVMTVAQKRLEIQRIEKGIEEAEAELAEMLKDGTPGPANRQPSTSDC